MLRLVSRVRFVRLVLVLCVCLGVNLSLFAAPAPAATYAQAPVDDAVTAEVAVNDTTTATIDTTTVADTDTSVIDTALADTALADTATQDAALTDIALADPANAVPASTEADIAAADAAVANPANAGAKRIIVSISKQILYAYQGNTLVFSAWVNARGTRGGTFRVQNKIAVANSYVRGWKLPYWMGIYYVGRIQNGIHGPATTRNGTATTSLGCVVLRRSADAAWLFRWASVGTPVTIRR